MNEDWIQRLTRPASSPRTPDSPDRGQLLIAVADSFWDTLKTDLRRAIAKASREPRIGRIEPHDDGLRLRLNGDGHGVDIRLELERERVRAFYARHPPRGTRQSILTLTLDIRDDALVTLDCRGCIVDPHERPEVLLKPFFRRLVMLPPPRKRPPLW